MRVIMASESAGICGSRIRNGVGSVRRHYIDVEIHQPFARNGSAGAPHTMRGMARRAGKPVIDVPGVFAETRIGDNGTQIVTFSTKRIRPIHAEIWIGVEIGNGLTRSRSLAEFITAFQDVGPSRTMRPIRPQTSKLAIVITVMAIGAENLRPHAASLSGAVQIEHAREQAGLRERAAPHMGDGMAGCTAQGELGDDVQKITRRHGTRRQIPKDKVHYFTRARSMAAKAILILIHRGIHHRYPVGGAHSSDAVLRGSQSRRWEKGTYLIGGVWIVTINATGVPVLVQQHTLIRVVRIGCGREGMPRLREFGEHVRNCGRHVGFTAVTVDAIILVSAPKQTRGSRRIVRHVTRQASVLRHS